MKIIFVHPQLPVPVAVLFLMYREQLIPCCPSGTPRLLDKDELAMENQQGAEGSDMEQKEHEAGGKDVEEVDFILQDFYFKMNDAYFIQWIFSWFRGRGKSQ